jgi:hypothetical protein
MVSAVLYAYRLGTSEGSLSRFMILRIWQQETRCTIFGAILESLARWTALQLVPSVSLMFPIVPAPLAAHWLFAFLETINSVPAL